MNVNIVYPPRPARRRRIVALHCSGAGGGQWRYLAEALGASWELLAPEHYGCDSAGAWGGEHAFTLADEAARTLALIDNTEGKVHLVGHSYGGALALHVALARPDRIASMALYEPSAFHLLARMGAAGAQGRAEIGDLIRRVNEGILTGDVRGTAACFVDYWSGKGAWEALRPQVQAALIRWAPKAPLDFYALVNEPEHASQYHDLRFPVLLLRGEHARAPSRAIVDYLATILPESRLMTIAGAGHMAPFTHAPEVSAMIVRHLEIAEEKTRARQRSWRRGAEVLHFPARVVEVTS